MTLGLLANDFNRGNELISFPNIFNISSVSKFGANDDKFSFLLIKFLLVVTHPRVYFSDKAFNTQLCLIKQSTMKDRYSCVSSAYT